MVSNRHALHLAVKKADLTTIRCLIEAGFPVNQTDRYGYTPLHDALLSNQRALVVFLIECGADVNCQNANGWAPLHWAVAKGLSGMVSLLLSYKADILMKTEQGLTAMDLLEKYPNAAIEKMLSDYVEELLV